MDGMYMFIGFFLIILASLVESFCTFGRQAMPEYKPGLLKGGIRWVFEGLWVLLLLAGGVSLLVDVWLFGGPWWEFVIGIAAFWLILPFLFAPILRRRLLPHWEEVKKELAPKGLSENTYWRDDWWMLEERRKKKKPPTPKL